MLLKGAYCVGEHFVDPQGFTVFFGHCENKTVEIGQCFRDEIYLFQRSDCVDM